jgi:hypothetical protein
MGTRGDLTGGAQTDRSLVSPLTNIAMLTVRPASSYQPSSTGFRVPPNALVIDFVVDQHQHQQTGNP